MDRRPSTLVRRLPARFCAALAAVVVLGWGQPAGAHPEVTVKATLAPEFDATRRLAAVHEKWVFDYFYSAMVGPLLDRNGDGVFDVQELVATLGAQGPLGWIVEQDYLTRLTIAGREVPHSQATAITVGVA